MLKYTVLIIAFAIPGVANAQLLDDLTAYWKLDEAANSTREDSQGANDLTDVSNTNAITSVSGNGADFTSDYLEITDNADLSTGDIDFTFSCWVYLDSKSTTQTAVSKYASSGNQREYLIEYDNVADRFEFVVASDGTSGTLATVSANNFGSPSTGAWYFIVAWHDATANTINIQVNGGTADSSSYSSGVFDGTAPFRLGYATNFNYLDGRLDEVAFWKRVLTAGERTTLYNSGSGTFFDSFTSSGGGGPAINPISSSIPGSSLDPIRTTIP